MRCALVQLCSGPNVGHNVQRVLKAMEEARNRRADVLVLPENVLGMHPDGPYAIVDRSADFLETLQEASARLRLWLVAGTIPWLSRPDGLPVAAGRVRAACFVMNDRGIVVGRYDKIHLFDVDVRDAQGCYRESDRIEPGTEVTVIVTPWGQLGLSVCYDVRFPELYVRMQQLGAQWLTIPSAFTKLTGAAHWATLVRARAIENQCFVVAPDQVGTPYAGRETWGHSQIVSPWGDILVDAGAEMSDSGYRVEVVEMDFATLQQIRQRMPIAQQRKLVL